MNTRTHSVGSHQGSTDSQGYYIYPNVIYVHDEDAHCEHNQYGPRDEFLYVRMQCCDDAGGVREYDKVAQLQQT